MTAAVLSIGTELTRGELINSNAAWLGERLTELGFDVVEHASIADDVEAIVAHLRRLAESTRVIVVTGGLGPTSDDMTSEAVARALGVPLRADAASLERIRGFFVRMGRDMPAINEKQALFPEGATVLPNDIGTAPGFAVKLGGSLMLFMPGVPREMFAMYEQSVLPMIGGMGERMSVQRHLRTFGQTESGLAELLSDIESEFRQVTVGYRASFPEIEVKVLARASNEAEAEQLVTPAVARVRERIGKWVFGERETSYAAAVGRTLANAGQTLALAESCTGGLVGQMLTSVPGSSDYLLLDAVVYSNAAKTSVLGVSEDLLRHYGAVSEECARAMAHGALRVGGSDLSAAITGIAGPGGGTDAKPVGTVYIGAATADGREAVRHFKLRGDRQRIRTMAAYLALQMVDKLCKGLEP